jgi:protein gp37
LRLDEITLKKGHRDFVVLMGFRLQDMGSTTRIPKEPKFLSIEPLLGPIPLLRLNGIDWVIVGVESGPGARNLQKSWVIDIRNQCQSTKVPFFFKQWGGVNKKRAGRILDGQTWDEMPVKSNST